MLLAQTGRVCANDLDTWINRVVNAPTFRKGRWGIKVQALQDGTVFYERNSNNFFIPASNMKLFVTAAALQRYGPDARRSEEHTSELQSLTNLVCRLLLEKKKKKHTTTPPPTPPHPITQT